ncbi:MAG: phytanoyl-CoA dioxygenase family protein [Caldilineaceae bacterium]|nr:phytanoyl-CoA dioxygenase family protein [Caldilineaceae bacterium]
MSPLAAIAPTKQPKSRPRITKQHADFYREHGYLVIENALTPAEVATLRTETVQICRGQRGQVHGLPPVLPGESDDEVIQRTICVHFPHKLSPVMYDFLAHPTIVEVLTRTIGPNIKCMQSMLFIKAAGKPGQAWHQDEGFIPTRDRSLGAAWMALDDATVDNGCLWVLPGSHKRGILWPHREHSDLRFDCVVESYEFPFRDEDAIPVEVKAGAIVFFNGYLLHRSLPNVAQGGFRRSLVNHYCSAETFLPWLPPAASAAVAMHDHRDIVLIAGEDPYAYKGTQEIMYSHIRPDREGGCHWPSREDA